MKFTDQEKDMIAAAIHSAEKNTSGEIRVHIEPHCKSTAMERAIEVFSMLEMDKTQQRNGVLIYIADKDQVFSIIGDEGINSRVPSDFWEYEKNLMQDHFKKSEFAKGISEAIRLVGEKLQEFFPFKTDDKDELSNEISYGKHE